MPWGVTVKKGNWVKLLSLYLALIEQVLFYHARCGEGTNFPYFPSLVQLAVPHSIFSRMVSNPPHWLLESMGTAGERWEDPPPQTHTRHQDPTQCYLLTLIQVCTMQLTNCNTNEVMIDKMRCKISRNFGSTGKMVFPLFGNKQKIWGNMKYIKYCPMKHQLFLLNKPCIISRYTCAIWHLWNLNIFIFYWKNWSMSNAWERNPKLLPGCCD